MLERPYFNKISIIIIYSAQNRDLLTDSQSHDNHEINTFSLCKKDNNDCTAT